MQEEKDMSVKEFFYLAFWVIVLALIASFSTASLGGAIPYPFAAPFGSAYSPPFYKITPTGCDKTLYYVNPLVNGTGNYSNHNLGQWNLFIHFGACPTNNLPTTCDPITGQTPYCGEFYTSCLSMYSLRPLGKNVIPNSKTWSQTYDHTPYSWIDLDNANKDVGFKSNFVRGAIIWEDITNLIIAASVFMWVGVTLFFLGPFFKDRPYLFRVTPLVLYFIGFLFWVIVLGMAARTSQSNQKAWSVDFFQTCDVLITKGPVYYYGVAVVAFSGLFIISEILFLYFHGYYPDSMDDDHVQSSTALVEKKSHTSTEEMWKPLQNILDRNENFFLPHHNKT